MKRQSIAVAITLCLMAAAFGYRWAGAGLLPTGTLILPSTDPVLSSIEYDPDTERLRVVLISGRVCEFEAVPWSAVEQFIEVEDKASWFLRVLLAEYSLTKLEAMR